MISFTLITDTPARLRDALLARGIITVMVDPDTGIGHLVGTKRGFEYVEVPNIILVTLTPRVADPRRVFLVKFAHQAEDDECEGEVRDGRSLLLRTKLGKWIMSNTVPDTLVSADGRSWPARNLNNNFWFVDSPDFGTWQP